MKKITLYILLFFIWNVVSKAQNLPQYSNYLFNKLAFNPAYAGSKEAMSMTAVYRNQWQKIPGSPKSVHVQLHAPFFNYNCGLGLSLTSDKIGVQDLTSLDVSYSYRMKVGAGSTLSIGLSGRMEYNSISWDNLTVPDVVDELLPDNRSNLVQPNFGGGIYFSNQQFYLGLSVPNILKSAIFKEKDKELISIVNDNTFYAMTGGVFGVTDNFKIAPSAMLSYIPNAPLEIDLGVHFIFLDAFWVGANYRFQDSFDGLVQYQINKQLKAGVAFDFTASQLNSYTSGSYELMIEYLLSFDGNKVNNIRFF